MKFNSQICTTKEQSERLLGLGLKRETADCQYAALVVDWKGNSISNPKWRFYDHNKGFIIQNFERMECIPAWSLHRLIEMMPEWISYPTQYDSAPLRINKGSMYYVHRFFDRNGDEDTSTVGDNDAIGSHNLYDYAVSVIGFLIREGYFCKEYLEERV